MLPKKVADSGAERREGHQIRYPEDRETPSARTIRENAVIEARCLADAVAADLRILVAETQTDFGRMVDAVLVRAKRRSKRQRHIDPRQLALDFQAGLTPVYARLEARLQALNARTRSRASALADLARVA
jgi:hypothetical protein